MSANNFHEGPLPDGFSLDFEPAIFNLPDFLRFQAPTGWQSFYLLEPDDRKAVASLHVHLEDGIANSPVRAPFGSIESNPNISPRLLFEFIAYAERQLQSQGGRELLIKNPPRAYAPEYLAMLETFLINRGFVVAAAEPGAINSDQRDPFTAGLTSSQSSRRKQAKNVGLEFRLLSPADLDHIFSFIEECYQEKGYRISITLPALRDVVERFPDRYVLSAVMENDSIRAAAISIRVNRDILYNFLVNHPKSYNTLSPPILLMEGLYDYCQDQRISMFDLGTSALEDKPKFSLLDFKVRMGAKLTSKFTFFKEIG